MDKLEECYKYGYSCAMERMQEIKNMIKIQKILITQIKTWKWSNIKNKNGIKNCLQKF